MGLDMYIYRTKKFICPKCGEVVATDIIGEESVCYWRKEWWLFNYISDEIVPGGYDGDKYGEYVPLSIEDLNKIKKKIISYYTKEAPEEERDRFVRQSGNIKGIEKVVKEMKSDPTIGVVYEADW